MSGHGAGSDASGSWSKLRGVCEGKVQRATSGSRRASLWTQCPLHVYSGGGVADLVSESIGLIGLIGPIARATVGKIRSRLERHALNHNLVGRAFTAFLCGRHHNYFGVLDPVNYLAKDRVLLIELRLFLQGNEPLTIRAVNVL